jgi:ABC-2 type transport system permease protein
MSVMLGRSMRHIFRSLLIAIASGISYAAYRLFLDMQSGIFERFHSMPIARSTVLWGTC